ncbi:MAG: ABC transporter permease [Burkholderiales bacterium]
MNVPQTPDIDRVARLREIARAARRERRNVLAWQVSLLLLLLAIWEFGTRVPWLAQNVNVLDPFFVSQPSRVLAKLYDWTFGVKAGYLWPNLFSTLGATFLGLIVAVSTGFAVGLLFSQRRRLAEILSPFIVALNSLPRIAFVPLITMILGLGMASKVATAWFIVFFLVFFNTFKGALSIERELMDFCRTLGASERQITRTVRIPNALAWTFTALPNAVSFSLIGVVLSEFVGSTTGMGYLIIVALATLNSAEMFAALTVLCIVGVVLVMIFRLLERRILRWAPEFREI